jgi:hypothetical protein
MILREYTGGQNPDLSTLLKAEDLTLDASSFSIPAN